MVEWNINHRLMVDMVNNAVSSSDFSGLKDWFKTLGDEEKESFKAACRERGLHQHDFASIISDFYIENPQAFLYANHHRVLVNWLFEKAWNSDRITVHRSVAIVHLLDEIFHNRMDAEPENMEIYLLQSVSIFDPLIMILTKYGLFDQAWELAFLCYSRISTRRGKFTPWKRIFLRHLAKIGKYRNSYRLRLTDEMKQIAMSGLKWYHFSTRRDINRWWRKTH